MPGCFPAVKSDTFHSHFPTVNDNNIQMSSSQYGPWIMSGSTPLVDILTFFDLKNASVLGLEVYDPHSLYLFHEAKRILRKNNETIVGVKTM